MVFNNVHMQNTVCKRPCSCQAAAEWKVLKMLDWLTEKSWSGILLVHLPPHTCEKGWLWRLWVGKEGRALQKVDPAKL